MPGGKNKFQKKWARFFMRFSGKSRLGRFFTRLASWNVTEYYGRHHLAKYSQKGYFSPNSTIAHHSLVTGQHVFIDDQVVIYADEEGGPVVLGDDVRIYRDTIIQTGDGGRVAIGAKTAIQPRCQFSSYKGSIQIGENVQIAPNCAFYPYDHSIDAGTPIFDQALKSRGGICIEDDVWLGVGVIVLDGVTIGKGAVIGAGSVVTKSIPENGIAAGVPAKVVKTR